MRVVLQKDMNTNPVAADDINMLVVYDNDEIIAAMWAREDGSIALTRAGEDDFEAMCKELSLEKRSNIRCVTVS